MSHGLKKVITIFTFTITNTNTPIMAEKNKVIKFFQDLPEEKSEQFNEAFALYRSSKGASESTIRSINVLGYNDRNLNNLLYDLQKLHGITDVEKIPSGSKGSKKSKEFKSIADELRQIKVDVIRVEKFNQAYTEALKGFEDVEVEEATLEEWFQSDEANAIIPDSVDDVLDAFIKFIVGKFTELVAEKVVETENAALLTENQEAKTDITLREEFPFLNDPDCPDELKILVADKLTAYAKYKKGVEFLKQIEDGSATATDEEINFLGKEVTEAFEENQEIYKELNVFKETGVLLGEHPLFTKLALTREVEAMSAEERIKFKQSSVKYFSDNKSKLATAKKAKDDQAIEKIEKRMSERSEKLFLVDKALGVKI